MTTGKTAYKGDLGNGLFDLDEAYHGNVGLKIGRYLNNYFDLNMDGTYGRIGYNNNEGGSFLANRLHMDLNLAFKFNNGKILKENAIIAPYAYAGVGFMKYNPVDNRSTAGTDLLIPLGLGAKVRLNSQWSAFWQSSFNFTNGDDADMMRADANASEMADKNDRNMMHIIGFSYSFGKGAKPDADKDGIADEDDKCPNTFGLKSTMGCPDTDMDGIIDIEDKCPNTAGPKSTKGCPDSDMDGIADRDDKCPNTAGSKSTKGCPDSDMGGVSDNEDSCPEVKGVRSNNGCPEISSTTIQLFKEALTGIQFESAKSVIKSSSFTILNKVVTVMKDNPAYQLSIEGHTDSSGDDAMNMKLSQERAESVKNYLVSKGVDTNRMTTSGFGETIPVASNETKEGKSMNRRVEFKVSF